MAYTATRSNKRSAISVASSTVTCTSALASAALVLTTAATVPTLTPVDPTSEMVKSDCASSRTFSALTVAWVTRAETDDWCVLRITAAPTARPMGAAAMETLSTFELKVTVSSASMTRSPSADTAANRPPRSIADSTRLSTTKVISSPPPLAAIPPPAMVTPMPFRSVSSVVCVVSTEKSRPDDNSRVG